MMGSNGILGRATSAVMEHKKAAAKEALENKILEITLKSYETNYRKPTLKNVAEELNADTENFRVIECDSKTDFDTIPNDVNNIKVICKQYKDIQLEVQENNGEFKVSVVGEEERLDIPDEPVAIIPEINELEIEEVTTNSFKVTVDATNAVSYDYTIDVEGEEGYPKEYTGESNAYYTFMGLKTGVDYTISVVAISSDGSKSTTHQTTGRPIEMPSPSITFTPSVEGWTRKVTITASTSQTGYTLKTRKNSEEYTTATSQTFTENGTMDAILTDGVNETAVATQVVDTIDRTNPNAPTLTPSGTKSEDDYTSDVTVTIADNGDTVGEVDHIEYTITGAQTGSSNNFSSGSTVTINTLGTSTITAYVVDKAGNRSSAGSLTVTKILLYTVSYNGNGATSGSTANSSHTYGTAKNLTTNGYARVGYDFLGWSTDSTAKTATYSNSQSVSNLSLVNGATIELFAVWKSKAGWINETVLGGDDVNILGESYSTLPNEIWVDGVKQSSISKTITNLSSGEHQVALDYAGITFDDMGRMFQGCRSIKDIEMSGLDSSSVKGMASMFYDCSSLERLDLSGLNTSGVYIMNRMFSGCSSLGTLILPNSGASSVFGAYAIFDGCSAGLQIPAQYETMYSEALVNAINNYTGTKTTY